LAAKEVEKHLRRRIRRVDRTEEALLPGIGPMELIVVLIIALMVLGPKRLPEAGRSVGRGLREFKDSIAGRDESEGEIERRPA
jgi:sec-independent protein translocase protein TatA